MPLIICPEGCLPFDAEVQKVQQVATPPEPSPILQTDIVSPAPATSEDAIWTQLRHGKGYVVMMRHALAPGTGDPPTFRLNDCATQRNLSEAGRSQAVQIGETFRSYKIPVARVLSSQWCRCLETAHLLNLGPVEPFPAINSFFSNRSNEVSQTEQVKQFMLQNRETAGVVVMITHQVNITAISGIVPESGAAVVFRVNEQNQIEPVGQIEH
jgi:phosphohistidine phosphatase SixA